jgi:AraC-like DNA-binding protein/mannose-6-phosphate isomerase-like protein (cupin superfamily)
MERSLLTRLNSLNEEETLFLRSLEADVIKNSKNPNFTIAGARVHKGKGDITLHIHSRYEPFPLHKHDFVEIMTVVSGNITHHINGADIPLSVGDILLMNKHISHSIDRTDAGDIGINFIISDTFLGRVAPDLADTVFSEFVKENSKERGEPLYLWFKTADNKRIGNLLENLAYELTESTPDYTVIASTLALLLRHLSLGRDNLPSGASPNKTAQRKRQITTYITDNYRAATLSELSEITYLSEPYLSKTIKSLFGKSFKELLIEERMRRAHLLLTKTDMPIGVVIRSVGYENESYFHREFRKRFEKSPLALRKSNRQ